MKYRRLIGQGILTATITVHTFSLGMLWFMAREEPQAVRAEPVTTIQTVAKQAISGIPVQIKIPSLGINLSIDPGVYDPATDSWTLSGYNAHYGTMTAPANDSSGNTFVYGHNNPYVFGPLKRIIPGANVEIIASNGNQFHYVYQKSYIVAPNDVSLFKYYGSPILTVQTCTGSWHEKRQLYEFKLVKVVESPLEIATKETNKRESMLQTISRQLPRPSPGTPLL